jgi:hypothetical protein
MQQIPGRLTSLLCVALGLTLAACAPVSTTQNGGDLGASVGSGSAAPPATPTTPVPAPPNLSPRISGQPALTAAGGLVYSFSPSASDPDGNALHFSASGLPGWLAINGETGQLSGTPDFSDVGETADIVVSVTDGVDSASLSPFRILVSAGGTTPVPGPLPTPGVNQRPVISGTPSTSVQATRAYSFQPLASDPNGSTLTFSIANKPSWAAFSTTTGQLSGTPAPGQTGSYGGIVIMVSDGSLAASLPAFALTVTTAPANLPPRISGTPATSIAAGTAYSFTPSASDPDGQTLRFTMFNKPDWGVFDTSTGRLSGTPTLAHLGTRPDVYIGVTDGIETVWMPTFDITVTDPSSAAAPPSTPTTPSAPASPASPATNQPPSIGGSPATSVIAGSSYSFRPTASDPEGSTLAFSITGKPSWASFSTSTGTLTGTPPSAGTYSGIVISVSDGSQSVSLPAFSISVSASASALPPTATGSATLNWIAPTQNTDGSQLSDLAGYRIYHGTSASSLSYATQVAANSTSYLYGSLASGTHYFAVTAYNSAGVESSMSAVGSKNIP